MLDFTSSLYLDLQHPADQLPRWKRLTTGKPAALHETSISTSLAKNVSRLTGSKASIVGVSTLHLYWDIVVWLSRKKIQVYCDEFAYPISSQLIKCQLKDQQAVTRLPHHDVEKFKQLLETRKNRQLSPILFADGYCPLSGKIFPVHKYIPVIEKHNGLLIIDDTQNIGLIGMQDTRRCSLYGMGGGGIKRWHGTDSSCIILISSLAKAFGVPVAALSGSLNIIESISHGRFSAMHCSQASNPDIYAALHALDLNKVYGIHLRRQLADRVSYFRRAIGRIREFMVDTCHPFQTIIIQSRLLSFKLMNYLESHGIHGIHHHYMKKDHSAVSFIITVSHRYQELTYLVNIIKRFFHSLNLKPERSHHEYNKLSA